MLTIFIQADPLETLRPVTDTTLALAREASLRGYTLYYYVPDSLCLTREGELTCEASVMQYEHSDDPLALPRLQHPARRSLTEADVVLIRQDPPVDTAYLTYAHLLEKLPAGTLCVNDPRAVRDFPEKMTPFLFPQWMPPTVLTRDESLVRAFAREYGTIVLKKLYGFAGGDVIKVDADDHAAVHEFIASTREPVIAQQFLPGIARGDRRIALIDGVIAGHLLRVPAEGQFLSNLIRGGTASFPPLTEREIAIGEALGPLMKERGIFLAGLDVIDGYLTEVNVTSPTGLPSVKRGVNPLILTQFWDRAEEALARLRA